MKASVSFGEALRMDFIEKFEILFELLAERVPVSPVVEAELRSIASRHASRLVAIGDEADERREATRARCVGQEEWDLFLRKLGQELMNRVRVVVDESYAECDQFLTSQGVARFFVRSANLETLN